MPDNIHAHFTFWIWTRLFYSQSLFTWTIEGNSLTACQNRQLENICCYPHIYTTQIHTMRKLKIPSVTSTSLSFHIYHMDLCGGIWKSHYLTDHMTHMENSAFLHLLFAMFSWLLSGGSTWLANTKERIMGDVTLGVPRQKIRTCWLFVGVFQMLSLMMSFSMSDYTVTDARRS